MKPLHRGSRFRDRFLDCDVVVVPIGQAFERNDDDLFLAPVVPSGNFASDEIPLKAIYTLFDGSDISCTQMNLQESLSQLLANTYLARYGKELIRNTYVVENLRQCSHLVNSTPVYRLERPRDLDRREDLAKLIESNHPILS